MGSLTDLKKAGDVVRRAWETDRSSLLRRANLGRSQKEDRTTTSYGTTETSEARTKMVAVRMERFNVRSLYTWSFPGKRSWSRSKENMHTRHQISHVPSLEHDANPS